MKVPPMLLLGSLFVFEGEQARAHGMDATANPYREGTQEHANWLQGWLIASWATEETLEKSDL
jgi:hypothetical protein